MLIHSWLNISVMQLGNEKNGMCLVLTDPSIPTYKLLRNVGPGPAVCSDWRTSVPKEKQPGIPVQQDSLGRTGPCKCQVPPLGALVQCLHQGLVPCVELLICNFCSQFFFFKASGKKVLVYNRLCSVVHHSCERELQISTRSYGDMYFTHLQ